MPPTSGCRPSSRPTWSARRFQDPASCPPAEHGARSPRPARSSRPHDPGTLCLPGRALNSLRQNVDAYATNIDGNGYRLRRRHRLRTPRTRERRSPTRSRSKALPARREGYVTPRTPTRCRRVSPSCARLARVERARLDAFFDFACFDHSFVDLRRRTRQDPRRHGERLLEVLRTARATLRACHVPSYTVRLLPPTARPSRSPSVRVSPVSFDTVSASRAAACARLRAGAVHRVRVLQVVRRPARGLALDGPRLRATSPRSRPPNRRRPATELLHFAIHSPRSPYGVPRWVGTLSPFLGSRQMEGQLLYFENKSVPPMALLVSGGRISEASVPRIERFIGRTSKGRRTSTRSSSSRPTARAPVTAAARRSSCAAHRRPAAGRALSGLRRAQHRQGRQRLPSAAPLARREQGLQPRDRRARAALRRGPGLPARARRVRLPHQPQALADMGIRFWRFRSQTPVTRDPERMTEMVERLVRVGVLTPEEGACSRATSSTASSGRSATTGPSAPSP